jgi:AbrB family looped-hinge helix DNA binding protein
MTHATITYKLGPKGQVVIPKAIRDRLGLRPGDRVVVGQSDEEVRIRKAVADPDGRRAILSGLRGALAGGPSLTAALERDRRSEREREERRYAEWRADRRP